MGIYICFWTACFIDIWVEIALEWPNGAKTAIIGYMGLFEPIDICTLHLAMYANTGHYTLLHSTLALLIFTWVKRLKLCYRKVCSVCGRYSLIFAISYLTWNAL